MKQLLRIALVTLMLVPALAVAQEGKAPEMDSATAAMMGEREKYATLGPGHERMAKEVGNWDVLTRIWMDPSQPPMESKGSCVVTTILGGRFLQSDYKGDTMGMPFEGIAYSGYDNHKKEYFTTWMDFMGTTMMTFTGTWMTTFTGTCKADGSECTFTTSFDDPIMKTPKSVREVCRYTSADSRTVDWYETTPGQPERKTMEIVHTRVK